MITLTYQITASLLQPLIGHFNDRHPRPYSLAIGMGFTLIGLVTLSRVSTYPTLLMGAALVGVGSAVFHPESSRVVRMVSGGQHGFAQALFQVGGNAGSSLGPLLAAFIVLPQRPAQPGMVFGGRPARYRRARRELVRGRRRTGRRCENRGPDRPNIILCYRRAKSTYRWRS